MYAVSRTSTRSLSKKGLKRAIFVEMLPSALIEGVMDRLKQDDTYDSVKDMVLDYVSTRVDFGGSQPMDCSNFNDYDDTSTPDEPSWMELNWVNKGEAKGKSKGKGFQGQCHYCGQFGHRAAECPAKGSAGRVVTLHTELRIAPRERGKARTTRAWATGKATSREKEKERIMASTIGTARAKVRLDHGTTPGRERTRPAAWSTMRTTMSSGTVRRRQRSSTCAVWTRTHPRQESP